MSTKMIERDWELALEVFRACLPRVGAKANVFEDYFTILAGLDESDHIIQMFDSTVIRAHVSAAGAKGGRKIKPLVARVVDLAPKSI